MKKIFLITKEIFLIFIILMPMVYIKFHSISGDASIYFSFVKNFFKLPFSYHPNYVAFGATSPLFVFILSPLYLFFGESYWIFAAKLLGILFICTSAFLINRSISGGYKGLILVCFFINTLSGLFVNSSMVFETSFAFFSVTLLYYFLTKRKYKLGLITSGSLYLVRPEFFLISIFSNIYILKNFINKKFKNIRSGIFYSLLSFAPPVIFHCYMYYHTQQLIPSSILGRAYRSWENEATWINNLINSFGSLSFGYGKLIYICFFIILIFIFIQKKLNDYKLEILLFFPILILYFLNPPVNYLGRYLLPLTSLCIILVVKFLVNNHWSIKQKILKNYLLYLFSILGILIVNINSYLKSDLLNLRKVDMDQILLKDLSISLNKIATDNDSVLIYEIQSQYYINAKCISLDGIVGNQLYPYLKKEKSIEDIIDKDNSIKYIVTMNSFNYRKLFDNSILLDLYQHDLNSNVGSEFKSKKLIFKKVITNSKFANSSNYYLQKSNNLNRGNFLRVMKNNASNSWQGSSPFWNSVYQIYRN